MEAFIVDSRWLDGIYSFCSRVGSGLDGSILWKRIEDMLQTMRLWRVNEGFGQSFAYFQPYEASLQQLCCDMLWPRMWPRTGPSIGQCASQLPAWASTSAEWSSIGRRCFRRMQRARPSWTSSRTMAWSLVSRWTRATTRSLDWRWFSENFRIDATKRLRDLQEIPAQASQKPAGGY